MLKIKKFMFKKKLILKIILSIVALGVIILCVVLLRNSFKPSYDGKLTIEVVGLDGVVIKEKEVEFNTNDALMDLIKDNFENVTYQNGMIMSIENYQTPIDFQTFLSVYVDDKMSEVGLSEVKFVDGTKISLIITEYISDWN